jgi:hypothetical protein
VITLGVIIGVDREILVIIWILLTINLISIIETVIIAVKVSDVTETITVNVSAVISDTPVDDRAIITGSEVIGCGL